MRGADRRGDLRASILAALRHAADAGESEFKLARSAGGSRAQVRNSLANLEMTGRVERKASGKGQEGRRRRTRIGLGAGAG